MIQLNFQITSFPLAVGVMKEHPKQLKSVTLEQRSILIADWMTSQNQLLAPQQLALTSECFTVAELQLQNNTTTIQNPATNASD